MTSAAAQTTLASVTTVAPIGLRLDDAAKAVGLSAKKFSTMSRDGDAPKPRISVMDASGRQRVSIWWVKDLEEWLAKGGTLTGRPTPRMRKARAS